MQNSAIAAFAAKSRNKVLKDVTAFFVGSRCVIVEMTVVVVAMRGSKPAPLCLHARCRALLLGFMQVLQLLSPLAHYPCFFQLFVVLLLSSPILLRYVGSWCNSHILKLMVTDTFCLHVPLLLLLSPCLLFSPLGKMRHSCLLLFCHGC